MGRAKKPTAELKLHGDYAPSRHGDRSFEPAPVGVPVRPLGFGKDAKQHWDDVVPSLIDTGVATAQDTPALIVMCQYWEEWQKARRSRSRDRKRLMMMTAASREWAFFACRFGLTPSDRAGLTGELKNKHDKVAQHLA